ncbi:uncharacterized protein C8A04DRAFT_11888 [Dichotomopilus funicola]|uniref:Uncharacterized protein n=1 Tax=Dichotomopilus funicola TaxID=1934379 RepID=A0AAN6ZMH5_9PEZI|nr:hypothetical protein C8A04DRAFT_11888 [Dichotomopilus funicola]
MFNAPLLQHEPKTDSQVDFNNQSSYTPPYAQTQSYPYPQAPSPELPTSINHNYNANNHRPPPTTATGTYGRYILKTLYGPLKFVLIFGIVTALLVIPTVVIDADNVKSRAEFGDDEAGFSAQQTRLVTYYVFGWLWFSWIALAACYAFGTVLPYVFRFVARYVNPGHARYWRVLRTMRGPICYVGLVTFSYVIYLALLYIDRASLATSLYSSPDEIGWIDILEDFLQQGVLWAWFYLVEKIGMLYITIHYHARSDMGQITRSKDMHNALIALYEASVYLYPIGTAEFEDEDTMIRNATGQEHGEHRIRATHYLSRLGIDTYGLTSFFGNFLSSSPDSHWLRPASGYATVERAIANPKSAAALARRIWMSFVPMGKEALTAENMAEVLGPSRKSEAEAYFKLLDEGDLGDLRLDEMEWSVTEAGRIRNNIYRNMHAADHCINTFDWVMLACLAGVMVYFILVFWVPALKDIQETIKILGFGLAFAVGRTIHHFLAGCIFILFDHPYDIGDRIELWNGQSPAPAPTSLIVTHTSLLYTIFRRVDNGMTLQAGNEYLQQCRIENVTRSGANRQAITLAADLSDTSFRDLQFLRSELEAFVKHPDNRRDYLPALGLSITNLNTDQGKMDLKCVFTHRSNWADEPLRAARSMKFMCALVAALRKIPLDGSGGAGAVGKSGNPAYHVMITADEAKKRKEEAEREKKAKRWDAEENVAEEDEDEDGEKVRKAREEAEKKKKEKKEKEEAELAARMSLFKIPAAKKAGPPPRETGDTAGGLTTGFQLLGNFVGGSTNTGGLRPVPHFKG